MLEGELQQKLKDTTKIYEAYSDYWFKPHRLAYFTIHINFTSRKVLNMGIELTASNLFSSTSKYLTKLKQQSYIKKLSKYGEEGVRALSAATPRDTGTTAASWGYKIERNASGYALTWTNNNKTRTNVPIVFLIEYGHAMPNGGHVPPRPFINQALEPVYDEINHDIRREVHR